MKNLFKKIKYFFEKFSWIKIINSPLKFPKFSFYFGKIKYGTPYFYPRKLIKSKEKPGYYTFKYVKWFWINVSGIGWKTKWDDIRFEWSPFISIVILNKQFFISINREPNDIYWEAWLYYYYRTNKNLSKRERIKQLFNIYGCIWTSYNKEGKKTIDYYPQILKKKYIKLYTYYKQ